MNFNKLELAVQFFYQISIGILPHKEERKRSFIISKTFLSYSFSLIALAFPSHVGRRKQSERALCKYEWGTEIMTDWIRITKGKGKNGRGYFSILCYFSPSCHGFRAKEGKRPRLCRDELDFQPIFQKLFKKIKKTLGN